MPPKKLSAKRNVAVIKSPNRLTIIDKMVEATTNTVTISPKVKETLKRKDKIAIILPSFVKAQSFARIY